mmetsp:Transcript_10007/g.14431  ORF Transcript_10007/g.14431 Transcript_10007/m.14431 type:complete len:128 (-) Transcript_10007:294-677(-)
MNHPVGGGGRNLPYIQWVCGDTTNFSFLSFCSKQSTTLSCPAKDITRKCFKITIGFLPANSQPTHYLFHRNKSLSSLWKMLLHLAARQIAAYLAATVTEGIYYWRDTPVESLPEGELPTLHSDNYKL